MIFVSTNKVMSRDYRMGTNPGDSAPRCPMEYLPGVHQESSIVGQHSHSVTDYCSQGEQQISLNTVHTVAYIRRYTTVAESGMCRSCHIARYQHRCDPVVWMCLYGREWWAMKTIVSQRVKGVENLDTTYANDARLDSTATKHVLTFTTRLHGTHARQSAICSHHHDLAWWNSTLLCVTFDGVTWRFVDDDILIAKHVFI